MFRQLPIDPADSLKLGFHWQGRYYLDKFCAFGFLHGSGIYQACSDFITFILAQFGHTVFGYLDDYILVGKRSDIHEGFQLLYHLIEYLDLKINPDKVIPPTKHITCLGITIDVDTGQASICKEKINEILEVVHDTDNKSFLSRNKFESQINFFIYTNVLSLHESL